MENLMVVDEQGVEASEIYVFRGFLIFFKEKWVLTFLCLAFLPILSSLIKINV